MIKAVTKINSTMSFSQGQSHQQKKQTTKKNFEKIFKKSLTSSDFDVKI